MVKDQKSQDLGEIKPPFAGLAGLSIFAWIIFGIFTSLDDDKYYFTATMFLSGTLAAYQLRHSRVNRNPVQRGAVAIFVMVWLAIFTFTRESSTLVYDTYSLSLKQVEFIALLPVALVWVPPYNEEKFFGLMDLENNDRLHAIWRGAVLFLIIINIVNLEGEWYWQYLEFLILSPMIYETVQLQKNSKENLPVLTLFIQTEMANKFAVPLSMFKSVFFIMVAFLFEILESRLWLLIILGYFGAGMMWGIKSIIPEEMRTDEDSKDEFADSVRKYFGAEERKRDRRRHKRKGKRKDKINIEHQQAVRLAENEKLKILNETVDIIPIANNQITVIENGSVQQKAHALGKRVRTGIEKPYYTLNHILSTLKAEDFSEAWRVDKNGLSLPSTRGKWSPSKGLILFPVDLEKYDYRRTNEILLLGFNRPFESKEGGFNFEIGGGEKSKARITDNSIKFGDVEFNTRSLIVTQEQWAEIKPKLSVVTQDDDISHTGFKTLNQMQEVLASLSDKWLEVRLTAQEAAVNFLAGLLGSSEPIFVPREGLEAPSYPEIEGKIVDTTVEEEDN
ncbi:MAG: hypothetical protein GPJ54_18355 [Candidatus Heimdallarchaeota archaeon]|nr:hypothetical protein [Candidatus Heimdallarchaeota archaeon]